MYDGYRIMGLIGTMWEWLILATLLVLATPPRKEKKGGVPRDIHH